MYLNLVGEVRQPNEDSWVIVNDTDEVFSPKLAKNIRAIISQAKTNKYDMIQVRCKSVTINHKGDRVHENMDDFHKPLIFKYYPGMEYWADRSDVTNGKTALHEALQVNGSFVWKPIPLIDKGVLYYEHVKLENIIWERGCRNFIVFGGGPNLGDKQPLWKPFRALLDEVTGRTDYTSYDILEYFKSGNIDKRIKEWMVLHRNENGYDGSSEVRECFLTYFVLYHPEEMPEELKGEYLGKEN